MNHRKCRCQELEQREKVIEIQNLCVKYSENVALENINFNVYRGEFLGIIGPNGGGKTTFVKAILDLVEKSSGDIRILGSADARSRGAVGYVPQSSLANRAFPITAAEVVLSARLKGGLNPFRFFKKSDSEFAVRYLSRVGIEDLAGRQVSDLSGGEFQRLLIARALATDPEILILDEPTASVDPASRNKIYALLKELNSEGMTVIMVTHDMMAVSSYVGRIACLNRKLAYHGEPTLTEEICNEMYGCPIDLIAHGVPHRVLGSHEHSGGEGHCCD